MIRLMEIDKDNLDKVLELKVHEDQAAYVSSVAFSKVENNIHFGTSVCISENSISFCNI